jgi:hypothetical protein
MHITSIEGKLNFIWDNDLDLEKFLRKLDTDLHNFRKDKRSFPFVLTLNQELMASLKS